MQSPDNFFATFKFTYEQQKLSSAIFLSMHISIRYLFVNTFSFILQKYFILKSILFYKKYWL